MKKVSPYWFLALLVTVCFTLATLFAPRAANWNGRSQSDNFFQILLGQGRRLFGNEMFTMADVYFHSGYYPSIFDQQETDHDVAKPAYGQADDSDSTGDSFLGPPPDWIAALDRKFVPNRHTHLSEGGPSGQMKPSSVQEILPWVKLAADMNPQFVKSYRVGAYWLHRLHKPDEARDFLLEGLHNNPGDPELLFDLGWLYEKSYHDTNRAENVWLAGLREWNAQTADARTNTESQFICDQIAGNLAKLKEAEGNMPEAIRYFEIEKTVSTTPDAVQDLINEARQKLAAQSSATNTPAH